MKFTLTLKDPDGPYEGIKEAARSNTDALNEDEADAVAAMREEELSEFVRQWLTYGEYATIEFDTDAGTAVLKKARD